MLIYCAMIDTDEEKTKFEQVYYKYKRIMLYAAYEILGNISLTEDAVHEAFIRIAKNLNKIDDVESTRTRNFALVIVKNVARTMRDKEQRYVELNDQKMVVASEDIDGDVLNKVSFEAIVRVLDELPAIYKEIAILYWLEDYSVSEVANILMISTNTVKKRIYRGRKILREKLMKEKGVHNGN